jgi:uncharacterized membrane protein
MVMQFVFLLQVLGIFISQQNWQNSSFLQVSLTCGILINMATVFFFAYLLHTFSAKKVARVNNGSYSLLAYLRVQQTFQQQIESRDYRIEAMREYDELMKEAAEYERS